MAHRVLIGILFSVVLAGCATSSRHDADLSLYMPADEAQAVIGRANSFALEGGTNGGTSPYFEAFHALYAQPDAPSRFLALLQSESLPAQLFGLMGLRVVDPESFEANMEPYLLSRARVEFLNGTCSPDSVSVSEIAAGIASGDKEWLLATW